MKEASAELPPGLLLRGILELMEGEAANCLRCGGAVEVVVKSVIGFGNDEVQPIESGVCAECEKRLWRPFGTKLARRMV